MSKVKKRNFLQNFRKFSKSDEVLHCFLFQIEVAALIINCQYHFAQTISDQNIRKCFDQNAKTFSKIANFWSLYLSK